MSQAVELDRSQAPVVLYRVNRQRSKIIDTKRGQTVMKNVSEYEAKQRVALLNVGGSSRYIVEPM